MADQLIFGTAVPPPEQAEFLDIVSRYLSKYRHMQPLYNPGYFRNVFRDDYPVFSHPIDIKKAWITQHFGANPASYKPLLGHDGIDYGANVGTAVTCPVEKMAIIDLILQTKSYGRHVWGQDPSGHRYIFGHLHEFCCSKGDIFTRGQIFATSGGNLDDPYHGFSTGPHLHSEWRPVWASNSNGYAGAVDQEPYITFGEVEPIPVPEPEPLFWLIVNTDGLQIRSSAKIPWNNNNRTGERLAKGTKVPVYREDLEGRTWAKISSKSERYACISENLINHMG